jgi:CRISPR system Cascade subunit CasA
MNPHYNLLDEPWLPVRLADGGVAHLGLLEVFQRGGEVVALAETAPPSLVAEYRLLLAIVHRALVRSLGTWKDQDRVRWYRHGLPVADIEAYLNHWRDRFWLFHAEHPFMQVATLGNAEETRDKRKPWTQISLASANGNAPVVFDHALDSTPSAIDAPAAVAHLLGFLQFTPGGLVKTLRDADKAGALVNTAAVLPVGETLAQTLCLALHAPPLPGQPQDDLPAWERPALTLAQLRGDPVQASGPNDRFTRQSRAVLLEREEDGCVRWLRFAAGLALAEDPHAPDPMACYRPGSNGLVRVGFTEGRALWRDLPAMVPAPQEGYQAASVMQRAAGLHQVMGRDGQVQSLLVAGVASDQAKLLRWRQEQVLLPKALLVDPACALDLRGHMALAEAVHQQLRHLATDLVAATLPDPGSKDTRSRARDLVESGPLSRSYFAAAERALPSLMDKIAADRPEEALTFWHGALRQAAEQAWRRLVALLGMSARALQAEARLGPRLHGLLRKQLSSAFADPIQPSTSQGA